MEGCVDDEGEAGSRLRRCGLVVVVGWVGNYPVFESEVGDELEGPRDASEEDCWVWSSGVGRFRAFALISLEVVVLALAI